jgi:hypothetical protein
VKNILIGFCQAASVIALSSALDDLNSIGLDSMIVQASEGGQVVSMMTDDETDDVLLGAVLGTLEPVYGCAAAWVQVI